MSSFDQGHASAGCAAGVGGQLGGHSARQLGSTADLYLGSPHTLAGIHECQTQNKMFSLFSLQYD
jgi:hypothetical protein